MRQLLLNLLLNAIDATPRGGLVGLECAVEGSGAPSGSGAPGPTDADHWVVIRVSDTGAGMPEELGERAFDPFVTTKETGVGLGLSICRRIVNGHDGQIAARNPVGGGALIAVRLPAADGRRADPGGAEWRHPPSDNGESLSGAS